MFGTAGMREIFSDAGFLVRCLDVGVALDLVEADLAAVSAALEALAQRHRDTPMAGRTHLQQALPITFGFKAAVWRAPIERHRERLGQMRPRMLVGQFGGAAGTLASLGEQGLAVRAALMRELGLAEPAITWHVAGDGLAEAVLFAGLVTGSLAKIATDVMLMMATELGEAFEPFEHGRGGSSTMPQKRNPISSELIVACAKLVRQHGALMLAGLTVDTARMALNLGMTSGLIVAEAVMMGLAPKLGRQAAHDVVYEACRAAAESGRPLLELLAANPQVSAHFGRAELERLLDPRNYLDSAGAMVDRTLGPE